MQSVRKSYVTVITSERKLLQSVTVLQKVTEHYYKV